MLTLITDILLGMVWVLYIPFICVGILRKRAVKGTRLCYVAKTLEIVLVVAIMTNCAIHFSLLMYLSVDPIEKGFYGVCGVAIVVVHGRILQRTLNDDDDDWFSDQWKKLKRWFKNFRMSIHLRPSPAF